MNVAVEANKKNRLEWNYEKPIASKFSMAVRRHPFKTEHSKQRWTKEASIVAMLPLLQRLVLFPLRQFDIRQFSNDFYHCLMAKYRVTEG